MTNFDFLKKYKQFNAFSEAAIAAERIIHIDLSTCVMSCRRAMELAVKWMYSVDGKFVAPYDDKLSSLIDNEEFRSFVGNDIWRRMDMIRKTGNKATHRNQKLSWERTLLCLENLFIFLDFLACCYAKDYEQCS